MIKQSALEYMQSYLPGRTPLEDEVFYLQNDIYNKIERFGELTLGNNQQQSVFTAIKQLAKTYPEVGSALSFSATPIGKCIDAAVLENPNDPWFDTVLLYRPDMLVSNTGKVYTNELEIVVGGICTISLLQNYVYGDYKLIRSLLSQMKICKEKFGLEGKIAFLADNHGTAEINCFKWVPSHLGTDIIIASVSQLDFKNDGVYFNNEKIAIAHIYIKAHKLRENITKNDELLLNHWLERNIALISPPSLVMDNKLIMYFLQTAKYQMPLQKALGVERYNELQTYLPKTYIDHDSLGKEILLTPWEYGKFIVKFPTLWGSRNMIASPESSNEQHLWQKQINDMLAQTNVYGPLLIQEMIDVKRIPFSFNSQAIHGITKFTPFFANNIFEKEVKLQAMAVNVTPSGFQAHIDENSRFALVERFN